MTATTAPTTSPPFGIARLPSISATSQHLSQRPARLWGSYPGCAGDGLVTAAVLMIEVVPPVAWVLHLDARRMT